MFRLLFSILFLFLGSSLLTAQLSPTLRQEVNTLDQQAEESLGEGNSAEAIRFLNQSAHILRNNNLNEEAVSYYQRILELSQQLGNQRGMLLTYNNLGMIYLDLEKFDRALPNLEKALELSRRIDTKESVISAITNLAMAHQGLGRFNESNKALDEAVQMAKDINDLRLLRRCYGILYENYEKLGQSDKSYQYFEIYSSLDREIKRREMQQVRQEAETEVKQVTAEKHLTEEELKLKKHQLQVASDSLVKVEELTREQRLEIEVKEQQIQLRDATMKVQRMWLWFAFSAVIFMSVFASILAFLFIKLRQANRKISAQNSILDRQNKNITSSIRYANTIQQAMLPLEENLGPMFDSFIIYKPKDIVSGDFYWFSGFTDHKVHPGKWFIAVVDCTGHGVPGAFMSLIGNRLLSEIVIERKVEDPKDILELLDQEIRIALRQEETDNNDGMDISFCKFEKYGKDRIKLTYSGAKRTAYIISPETKSLNALKGDRKSIGGLGENKEGQQFTNHEVDFNTGDLIYLSTDGIIDQNAPDRKRYGSKRLENFLISHCHESLNAQKEALIADITQYMANEEQRDDITLIGLKIK